MDRPTNGPTDRPTNRHSKFLSHVSATKKNIQCWVFKITLTLIIYTIPVLRITPFTPANKQWVSHLFHTKLLLLQYTLQVRFCPLMVITTTIQTNNHASHRTSKVVINIEVKQFSHQRSLYNYSECSL